MNISFFFIATILNIEAYNNPLSGFAQTTNETPNQQQQTSQLPSSPARTTPTQSQVVPINLSILVAGGNIGSENSSTQGNNHILTGG
jgi:hypothetical protein